MYAFPFLTLWSPPFRNLFLYLGTLWINRWPGLEGLYLWTIWRHYHKYKKLMQTSMYKTFGHPLTLVELESLGTHCPMQLFLYFCHLSFFFLFPCPWSWPVFMFTLVFLVFNFNQEFWLWFLIDFYWIVWFYIIDHELDSNLIDNFLPWKFLMPFPEKISSPTCRASLRSKYGVIHPFISLCCHFFPSWCSFFPPFSFSSFSPLASSSHSSNHWGSKLITFSVFYTEVNTFVLN